MKNMMKYKGYYGSVEFDSEELIFYGKLEFINSLVSYEGKTASDINQAFHDAVEDYLVSCKERGIIQSPPGRMGWWRLNDH